MIESCNKAQVEQFIPNNLDLPLLQMVITGEERELERYLFEEYIFPSLFIYRGAFGNDRLSSLRLVLKYMENPDCAFDILDKYNYTFDFDFKEFLRTRYADLLKRRLVNTVACGSASIVSWMLNFQYYSAADSTLSRVFLLTLLTTTNSFFFYNAYHLCRVGTMRILGRKDDVIYERKRTMIQRVIYDIENEIWEQ